MERDLGEMGAVEVERSAAKEDTAGISRDGGFGYGEVADVLADLGVVAAEEGAVAGEGVDEVEDGDGVGELGFAHGCAAYAEAGMRRWIHSRSSGGWWTTVLGSFLHFRRVLDGLIKTFGADVEECGSRFRWSQRARRCGQRDTCRSRTLLW